MKLYKLTDQDSKTHGGMEWGEGVTHKLEPCKKPQLCTSQVLHAYKNPNLALLLNPIHADIKDPFMWEAEGDICIEDYGKCACFELTTVKQMSLPNWYQQKRQDVQIQFAILCAEVVLKYFKDKYPTDDRPRKAIEAAKDYLKNKQISSSLTIIVRQI